MTRLDWQGERKWETAPCALANKQAGQLMVVHFRAAPSWHTCAESAGSPRLPEDRAPSPPSPNIETTFSHSSLSFHKGKLQFEVFCNHLIV